MLRPCLVLFALLTLLTGVIYPLVITLAAQMAFPSQANGSLIREGDRIIGSRLIGQPASDPGLFSPRPSAVDWNAAGSGGANLAPVAQPQRQAWAERAAALRAAGVTATLPADLVTASGSGLDPHLSPAAALIQVPRIAAARKILEDQVLRVVSDHLEEPQVGVLGAARVNVLELNRALLTMPNGGP
jgi:K+-transporting ATPase ATPase C chain